MADTEYILYVRLVQNLIALFCKTITIAVLLNFAWRALVRRNLAKIELSKPMWTFIWCHLVNCLYSYTYHLYCVLLWRGTATRYQPYVLFWTGLSVDVYYGLAPIPLFFLTVDRCLTLVATYRYGYVCKQVLFVFELATLFVATVICVLISVMELPLDEASAALCTHVACFMVKYHLFLILWLKTIFGVSSFVGSIFFFALLRFNKSAANIRDRVIKLTIVVECICCVMPGLVALVWGMVFTENLSKYIGEHATLLLSVDGAIFSVVFFCVFMRRKGTTVTVSSTDGTRNRTATGA